MTNYQSVFDQFVFATYDDIRVVTLEQVAADLGVAFDSQNYDFDDA